VVRAVAIRMRAISTALLLAAATLLGACGGPPPPPPPPPPTLVELTFTAAPDINPDPSGRPSPIFVRFYQLGGTETFSTVDYFQLHDKDSAILGPSLLDRQELPLTPGAAQTIKFTPKPGTVAIGVVAAYRDIDHAQWRAQAPVAPNKTNKLQVQLNKLALSVTTEAK
jgi:type VI secretion system protein VasD